MVIRGPVLKNAKTGHFLEDAQPTKIWACLSIFESVT
jgi:hypothetical protein